MTEQKLSAGDRVKTAREARGWSQEDLGKQVGISQPAVKKIEDGSTKRSKYLPRIAAVLGLNVHDLDEDGPAQLTVAPTIAVPAQPLVTTRDLPVYAAAQGGEGHMIVNFDPVDFVKRPIELETVKTAYAMLIVGDSLAKAYRHGDLALVNPLLRVAADEVHVLYATDPTDGTAEAIIKNILGWTERKWKLEQFNPERKYEVDRTDWPTATESSVNITGAKMGDVEREFLALFSTIAVFITALMKWPWPLLLIPAAISTYLYGVGALLALAVFYGLGLALSFGLSKLRPHR